MALPADYISGTITLTNGSNAFTGTGTGWQAADFREGDILLGIEDHAGQVYVIATITGQAAGTLTQPWAGTSGTYTYRMRYEWDSSRVSAQARAMVELLGNGNLESIAGLTGPGVVVLEGPHSAGIRPFADFINGVAYDVQVDTLADRAAYDGQSAGFTVLVSDVGDGRSAVYSKASNTSGDWTDPAYVTGPVGPGVTLDFSATGLPPGSTPTVNQTPVPGGYEVELGIPDGRGAVYVGAYNPATAYVLDDAVLDNGSTWIALGPTTGNAPPTLPTTANAYWSLLARRGTDGTGTGDVVGPASSVNNRIAVFNGTTGNLIADGGVTIADLVPADGSITNAKLADVPTATIKGRVTAGTGDPEDLTRSQVAQLLGGWEIISTQAGGGATAIEWLNLSAYRTLWLIISIAPSSTAPLAIRHSKTNGSSYLSGASEYHRNANTVVSTPSNTPVYSSDNYRYLNTIANCNVGEVVHSECLITDWNVNGRAGAHWSTIFYSAVDNSRIKTDGSGTTATLGPHDALQLSMPGATIQGSATLLGIRG